MNRMSENGKRSMRYMLDSKMKQIFLLIFLVSLLLFATVFCLAHCQYDFLATLLFLMIFPSSYCLWLFFNLTQEEIHGRTDDSRTSSDFFKAIPKNEQSVTCPDCGLSFHVSSATRFGQNVVLCPVCSARLRINKS